MNMPYYQATHSDFTCTMRQDKLRTSDIIHRMVDLVVGPDYMSELEV